MSGILLETVDRGTSNETPECGNVTVTRKRSKKTQEKWRRKDRRMGRDRRVYLLVPYSAFHRDC